MRTGEPARWFRMYAEFATDPKVQMLSEIDQRRFLMLLCLRCCNGDVTLQDTEVAFQLRVTDDEYSKTKAVLTEKGLIGSDNKPASWEKRQMRSDTSNERVSRFREKLKQEGNDTVTLQKRTVEKRERESKQEKLIASHDCIVFDGSSFQNINGHFVTWQAAYPAISIQSEMAKAAAWLVANPKNKKSNYARFLNGWFSRAQDKAPASGGGQQSYDPCRGAL